MTRCTLYILHFFLKIIVPIFALAQSAQAAIYYPGGNEITGGDTASLVAAINAANASSDDDISDPDIANLGTITVEGYNLIDAGGYSGFSPATTDILITSLSQLNLGPLQNNGGLTYTMALMPGSLAINNGINPLFLLYDQRGTPYNRVCNAITDIGAYELHNCLISAQ